MPAHSADPEPDPFRALIPEARAFLTDLAADNSRTWFAEHKAQYDDRLRTPALHLLDAVAADLRRLTGTSITTKLYRPQRDVRFTIDKTPYHAHLHMHWKPDTGTRAQPGFFFGVAPGYVTAGAGVMAFDKSVLAEWRARLDTAWGADLAALIAAAGTTDADAAKGAARLRAPDLRRVPAPYAQDHPRADLLRRKSLVLSSDLADSWSDAPLARSLMQVFARLHPTMKMLSSL